jgi:phosphatidylglycerol:prolipoprotein diacylglycerol transferase
MGQAYPLLFSLGTLAGLAWLLFVDPRRRPHGTRQDLAAAVGRVDVGVVALACGLAGARLSFVAAHAAYFSGHLDEIVRFSDGGVSWVGGALGALVAVVAIAARRRASVWTLVDGLAIPAALLAMAAWGGCLLDGCGFGRPLEVSATAALSTDIYATRMPRWPTQLLGLLAALALALGLLALEPRVLRPGLLASLALIGLGGSALALSFARGDPVPLWAGLRLDALGAALITALGIGGALLRRGSAAA